MTTPRTSFLVCLKLLSRGSAARRPPPPSRPDRDPTSTPPERSVTGGYGFRHTQEGARPLHVSDILERIHAQFGVVVDRDSLVSSLTKKVARRDRFLRPEKNTFSLRPEAK